MTLGTRCQAIRTTFPVVVPAYLEACRHDHDEEKREHPFQQGVGEKKNGRRKVFPNNHVEQLTFIRRTNGAGVKVNHRITISRSAWNEFRDLVKKSVSDVSK